MPWNTVLTQFLTSDLEIYGNIYSDILPDIYSISCSDIVSEIYFDMLSGKCFGNLFWHSDWHLFWHSNWHLFRHSFWHSCSIYSGILFDILSGIYPYNFSGILPGIYSDILAGVLAEVQQCPLRSGACVPTEIWSYWLKHTMRKSGRFQLSQGTTKRYAKMMLRPTRQKIKATLSVGMTQHVSTLLNASRRQE